MDESTIKYSNEFLVMGQVDDSTIKYIDEDLHGNEFVVMWEFTWLAHDSWRKEVGFITSTLIMMGGACISH